MTRSKSNLNRTKLKTEIAIIGAGGCGLAAAVAAAEKGAKVIVLENRRRAGGATMFAEGPFAADSPVQKRLNIDCTSEALFKMHMIYNHWEVNAGLVRAIINKSGDTIQWLEDQGVDFYMAHMSPGETLYEWHNPRKGGPDVIQAFLNTCQKLGVQILYETRVNKILTDASGTVNGVAADAKGTDLTIQAKSVIIATGGFGGNKRMMRKYTSFLDLDRAMKRSMVTGVHNGDGIRMAFELGAASDGLGNLCLHGPLSEARRAFGIAIEAKTVWINRDGERFMEESASFNPFESGNGVLRQPGQICFSLFDEGILQDAINNGMDRPFESSLHSHPQNQPKLDSVLEEEAKLGHLKISKTWDKLAGWMGVNSATLKNTIQEYNADCDRGRDHLFAKDPIHLKPLHSPPYYSIRCSVGYLSTLGGIKINHLMEVLNNESKPIPGLYAGGNDVGGFSGSTYNVHLAGTGCGFAFNSGRIAGENATKYASQMG